MTTKAKPAKSNVVTDAVRTEIGLKYALHHGYILIARDDLFVLHSADQSTTENCEGSTLSKCVDQYLDLYPDIVLEAPKR